MPGLKDKPLAGRVIVVTGAAAGVGRAIVREFAKEKAKIGLIARGVEGLAAAKSEIEAQGGEALVLSLIQQTRMPSRKQLSKLKRLSAPLTSGSIMPWFPYFLRWRKCFRRNTNGLPK